MPLDVPPRPAQHQLRDRTRRRAGSMPVRHGRLKRSNPVVAILKFVASAVAVLMVSSAGVAAYAVVNTVSSIKPGIHLASLPLSSRAGMSKQAAPVSMNGAINVLLTGTDTRTGQGGQFSTADELAGSSGAGNNDVTMVLHVAADHKSATVISIPRDLMVPVPACPSPNGKGFTSPMSSAMFNTTLSTGGLSCVVMTAEQLTGLDIPYAAENSFDGVIALSNAVGGVTVCLATPLDDPYVGLKLAAGQQTLVGAQALAYVRSRHGVGDGSDLGRISDQQLFLSALMRKLTSSGVLGNPVTLYSLAKAAVSNMQLSDTLTQPATMVSMALALKGISLSNMVFLQYPATGDPDQPGRVIPDKTAVTALKGALSADLPVQLTGGLGRATESSTPTPAPTPSAAVPAPAHTTAPVPAAPAAPAAGATPTPTPTPTSVALPTSVTGQTAAQQTCTRGNN